MNTNRSVRVKDIVEKFQMEVINRGTDYDTEILTITDVNRPGLQFIGFFDYFDPRRLQIIGKSEVTFLRGYSSDERRKCFEDLFCYEIPALVVSRNLDIFPECLEMAQKYGRTLLRTHHTSVEFTSMTIDYLNHALAPVITRHGVLVDVYGVGMLITGNSGVGKSEAALELVKRGHRLVADDVVEICRVNDHRLTGTAPDRTRHFMEIRGVGIIDVYTMYGVASIIREKSIDMEVHMELWQDGHSYDRLGLDNRTTTILGVSIPSLLLPIHPGRNIAIVLEVAARNLRLKQMGYSAAEELLRRQTGIKTRPYGFDENADYSDLDED